MKFLQIKRKTKNEIRFTKNMGSLSCRVTKIWLTLFGLVPIKKLHSYRDTYYGKIKDLKNCNLQK